MSDDEFLALLRCPLTCSPLTWADEALLAQVNRAAAARKLRTRSGEPVERPLDGGLVNADQSLLYPVRDNIPDLIADDALPLPPPAE